MTEKNYNPEQKQQKTIKKQEKIQTPVKTENLKKRKVEKPVENTQKEAAIEDKAEEQKKEVKKINEAPKKTKVVVNGFNIPISTKHSMAICMFIKRKKIQTAIKELELVSKIKKPVPMKGEIPHRKGNIMAGRYPEKAARQFIILLKSLASNSINHGIENPVIVEAFANIGARPFGKGGVRRKRTHILIAAESAGGKK